VEAPQAPTDAEPRPVTVFTSSNSTSNTRPLTQFSRSYSLWEDLRRQAHNYTSGFQHQPAATNISASTAIPTQTKIRNVTEYLLSKMTEPDQTIAAGFARYIGKSDFPYEVHCLEGPTKSTLLASGQHVWRLPLFEMPGPDLVAEWTNKKDCLRLFHATAPRGLMDILQTKKLSCFSWESGGAGDHGVYARGFKATGTDWDKPDIDRVINNIANAAKNLAGIIVEAAAIVETSSIKSGGIPAEATQVVPGKATHYPRDKRWCVHPQDLRLQALWYIHEGPQFH
jgi:hypothetical protein